jgi:hypothetical protein
VILLAAACSGDDDGGGGGGDGDGDAHAVDSGATADGASADAPVSSFAVNLVERTCGPTDGPAITVALGAASDPETCSLDFDAATLMISIYLDTWDIEAPVTYTFDPDELTGSAQSCPGGEAACRAASGGELHFDTFSDGEGASGTYQLTLDSGPVSGGFDATWCTPEGGGPYCG